MRQVREWFPHLPFITLAPIFALVYWSDRKYPIQNLILCIYLSHFKLNYHEYP